ncbi:putative ankyrin repeat protein RF_0381 [Mytilus trossulus]|uniref:putative ankyrin repeat protein RF_0381 n=1 Tax=Mytilus trossulus TaxID=6551 RepID=UPI003007B3F4
MASVDESTSNKDEGELNTKDDLEEDKQTSWSLEQKQRLLADAISMKSPIDDIKSILKCGADINGPVKKGLRPLHYAAYVDYVECVNFLIDEGADVNTSDEIGYTPLHLCARKGVYGSMKALIEKGALVNYCDADENELAENVRAIGYLTMEPLNLAIENNNVDCVRLLLKSGARPNHQYFIGCQLNVMNLENLECLEILLENGADPNSFNRCGIAPLMKACREHNIEAVRILIKHGADINAQCPSRFDQKFPIHFSIESGNIAITELLIEEGAQLTRSENYRYSPLHAAILKGRSDIVYFLLLHNAVVDETTDDGCTPLMLAAGTPELKERKEIIKILLEHGANVNASAQYISYMHPCMSPIVEYLKCSPYNAEKDILLLLLKYGAKVNIRLDVLRYRRQDPFGILNYLGNCSDKEMMDILVYAAQVIHKEHIQKNDILSPVERRYLLKHANTPRPLKHTIRLLVRDLLDDKVLDRVDQLPLPSFIKKYLLYEVN